MKKFLRMLSIAMALVMCFTMVFTTAVSAEGTTPAITLGDAKTALAGATVTIPVTAEGFADAGIVGAEFNVNLGGLVYERDDAVVDGEAVANYADGVVRYADVPGLVTGGEVAAYEDGTIFTITATIPEDAETDATYTVTVSYIVAGNSAEEKITVTGGEVVITVLAEDSEPEIVTMTLGRQVLARDRLGIRMYVKKAQVKEYADYYIEVSTKHFVTTGSNYYQLTDSVDYYKYSADGSEIDGYTIQATEDTDNIYFDYVNISAFEANLPISIVIYCLDANGDVFAKTKPWEFSLASRLLTAVVPYSSGDSLTTFMDMINYCTDAQIYFASLYPNSDLAANLETDGRPDAGFEQYQEYATQDDVMNVDMAETVNKGTPVDGYTAVVGKGLQIQASNNIYFTVNPSTYDISKLTLKVNYIDSYNVDKTVSISVSDLAWDSSRQRYMYFAEGDNTIALYDTGVKVIAELFLEDTLIYTRDYSVESFIYETMKNNEDQRDLADSILKFTYSVRKVLFG